MALPLYSDLKNDKKLPKNLLRVVIFILVFFILDNVVSFILLKGIDRNYGLGSNSEVLMIGHSHLMLAIDKVLLEKRSGLKVAKYTREGVNVADRKIMLEHYFMTCTEKPEIVILGVDPWLFTGEGLSKNSYVLFLPFIDSPEIKDYVKKSVPKKSDYLKAEFIKTTRYNALLLNASIRGWLKNWNNLKIGTVDSIRIRKEISAGNFRKINFDKNLMNDFSEILDYLSKTNSEVILLNTPVWEPLLTCQREEYTKAMHLIDSLAQSHCPSAELVDFVPRFSKDTKFFFDPIHMNPEGQKAVTEALAVVVDSLKEAREKM